MAVVFPRPVSQFIGKLPISSCVWRVARSDEFAALGSSQSIPIELADPLWAADITIDKQEWADWRKTSARLNSLEGSIRDFHLYNPIARAPAADPGGALLGAGPVTISAIGSDFDSVRLTGLPAGYQLTEGDFFSVFLGGNQGRPVPFQLLEDAKAAGNGTTPLARVFPHVWPGISVGLAVTLVDPIGKFSIIKDTLQVGAIRSALVDGSSFSVLQRI